MNRHIIIIHEIYGVTENLIKLKNTLVKSGFTVSLPSLYEDNYEGSDEKISYDKFYSEVGLEKAYNIINEIIQENREKEIVLIGFSTGATVAWLHSANKRVKTIIGIYGSRIRNYLEIEPAADANLFFCREPSFDIEKINNILNMKKNVLSEIIPGNHGFYGKSAYDDLKVQDLNEEILRILNKP